MSNLSYITVKTLVIGGGVIGVAIARALALRDLGRLGGLESQDHHPVYLINLGIVYGVSFHSFFL